MKTAEERERKRSQWLPVQTVELFYLSYLWTDNHRRGLNSVVVLFASFSTLQIRRRQSWFDQNSSNLSLYTRSWTPYQSVEFRQWRMINLSECISKYNFNDKVVNTCGHLHIVCACARRTHIAQQFQTTISSVHIITFQVAFSHCQVSVEHDRWCSVLNILISLSFSSFTYLITVAVVELIVGHREKEC